MPRRALIFNVAPGKELHYLKIPPNAGGYVGRRWAPFFHAYGYYLPTANVSLESRAGVNEQLIKNSQDGVLTVVIEHLLLWLALGGNPALISLIGGVLWAEMESAFAYWDGHVTFGSSHVSAHCLGYGLGSIFLKKGFSKWELPFMLFTAPVLYFFVTEWVGDGFDVVSQSSGCCPHRIDHMAHIGGVVTGVISACLTKNKRLI